MPRLLKTSRSKNPKPRTSEKTKKIRKLLRDGLSFKSKGEHGRAGRSFDQVFRIEPENADALYAKCELYFETKQYSAALHLLERCRRSKPKNPQLNYIIGYQYEQLKRYDKAVVSLEAALRVRPDFGFAKLLLVKIYHTIGQTQKALELIETLPDPDAGNTPEALTQADVYTELGLFERSVNLLKSHWGNDQYFGDLRAQWSKLPDRYQDGSLAPEISMRLSQADMPAKDRSRLNFLAGRIADKEGRLDDAFAHFAEANNLLPGEFDFAAMDATVSFIEETFSPDFDFRYFQPSLKDVIPVFIVGMPRAGKTTLEGELARHPDIADCKERDLRMYIDDEIFIRLEGKIPESLRNRVKNMSTLRRKEYAKTYLDQVLSSQLLPAEPRYVLNTLPLNFQNAGMLKMLFPNAKFINMRRNPIDTCWFCYSKSFAHDYSFTNRLDLLGKYYGKYRLITGHWKTVLGEEWLDVDYEELINAPKTTVLRVLEFMGARDAGRYASQSAVGEGFSTRYIDYWKNYEKHLQPLLKSLNQ